MRRDARRQRGPKPNMLSHLDTLIGPSAANWLIVAGVAVVLFAAAALGPGLMRRLFKRGRNPLL